MKKRVAKKKTIKKTVPRKIFLRFESESIDLQTLIDDIISESPQDFLDFRAGQPGAIDKLVNKAMKRTQGKVDPQKVRKLIISKL